MTEAAVDTRVMAAVTSDLLEQGRQLHAVSKLLSLIAGHGMLAGALLNSFTAFVPLMCVTLVLGIVETYLALRVNFDAALFRRLACEVSAGLELDALDIVLLKLDLAHPAKAGRSVEVRSAGARRLLKLQGLALVGQAALLMAGAYFSRMAA